jgi:amino acid adenylation domain-containing protein
MSMHATVPSDWSTGAERPLPTATAYDLFDRRLAMAPDAPAAHSDDRSLTYRELDEASTAVASRLIDDGVEPGSRVGVLVDRSVDVLIGLLAVWKAGCVYLPLDVDHPVDRLGYLLADAQAAAVVTSRALADRGPDEPGGPGGPGGPRVTVLVDDRSARRHPVRRPGPRDPAYLIYTSGSTGRPKAVGVEHGSLVNVVDELGRILRMGPAEHWLTMAPSTFDISLAELCVPLAAGAQLTITSAAQARDAAWLVRLIQDRGITRMQAVPSQWRALVDAGLDAPGLYAMSGGEALPAGLAAALTRRLHGIVNAYGPTETTIVSTVWAVPAEPAPAGADDIRIGRPIANTRVYVLDDDLAEVPIGVAGELFIGGLGVARGYVNEEQLTAESFLDDPGGGPGERRYRTGDRCRWRADGNLEYLGRTDSQVKIRGQRVELGEVEAGLVGFDPVGAAVAVLRDQDLVAFVVPADPAAPPTPAQVREHAARTLTTAMAPTAVVVLDAFPLTPNGKIDRAALSATAVAAPLPRPEDGPQDPFTAELCALIEVVLGAERVRPADDFFDVGGHSLAVMRMVAAIADRWQIEVASDVFYDTETVADLACAVNALRAPR